LETTINDVDLTVYREAYVWDSMEILAGWYSAYDFLPDPLRQLIIIYYQRKTELKGVAGQELFYDLAKALLNSIYGMMAQDPVKQDTIFNGIDFEKGEEDLEGKLAKHSTKAFTSHAWGCWTTSLARLRLWEGIKLAGRDFAYCDTDSVKALGALDVSAYNEARIRDSLANGAYATDPHGVTHYMGVLEYEGRYQEFVTMGAKKYGYVDSNNSLHITIAGVGKRKGAIELEDASRIRNHCKYGPLPPEASGGLDQFQSNMVFRAAGGTESIYNDLTKEVINIDGHNLELGPNIYIRPSTYTLGLTNEYGELLADPESYLEILNDRTNFDDFEHEFN
jgi:hypothetical protein